MTAKPIFPAWKSRVAFIFSIFPGSQSASFDALLERSCANLPPSMVGSNVRLSAHQFDLRQSAFKVWSASEMGRSRTRTRRRTIGLRLRCAVLCVLLLEKQAPGSAGVPQIRLDQEACRAMKAQGEGRAGKL